MEKLGIHYHFIDAEWSYTDPAISTLEIVFEKHKHTIFVPTISVRRSDAERRLTELLNLLSSYENIQPCLVAGNPAYLTANEAMRNPIELIERYAKIISKIYDGAIYIGCERIESKVNHLTKLYRAIPYYVYSKNTLKRIVNQLDQDVAIYIPVLSDDATQETLDSALAYIRRRTSRGMESIDPMGMIGDYIFILDCMDDALNEILKIRSILVFHTFNESLKVIHSTLHRILKLIYYHHA